MVEVPLFSCGVSHEVWEKRRRGEEEKRRGGEDGEGEREEGREGRRERERESSRVANHKRGGGTHFLASCFS